MPCSDWLTHVLRTSTVFFAHRQNCCQTSIARTTCARECPRVCHEIPEPLPAMALQLDPAMLQAMATATAAHQLCVMPKQRIQQDAENGEEEKWRWCESQRQVKEGKVVRGISASDIDKSEGTPNGIADVWQKECEGSSWGKSERGTEGPSGQGSDGGSIIIRRRRKPGGIGRAVSRQCSGGEAVEVSCRRSISCS